MMSLVVALSRWCVHALGSVFPVCQGLREQRPGQAGAGGWFAGAPHPRLHQHAAPPRAHVARAGRDDLSDCTSW